MHSERLKAVEEASLEALQAAYTRGEQGGVKVPRPSGIYRCERAQVLEGVLAAEAAEAGGGFKGEAYSARTMLAFYLGTAAHTLLQAGALDKAPGPNQCFTELKVIGRRNGRVTMTGSADFAFPNRNGGEIWDLKTTSGEGFAEVALAGEPKAHHVGQVNWYAYHAGYKRWAVIYLNKNGTVPKAAQPKLKAAYPDGAPSLVLAYGGDVYEPVEEDEKALRIIDAIAARRLPSLAANQGDACRWCYLKATCEAEAIRESAAGAGLKHAEWNSKVVGTTFRQASFPLEELEAGEEVDLRWEPDNQHAPVEDGRSIAVGVWARGEQIGYLPSTGSPTASLVAAHYRAGGLARATVEEVTGGTAGKANRGVNLRIKLLGD